jgi:ribosomal-protein-serine acetyltransferase
VLSGDGVRLRRFRRDDADLVCRIVTESLDHLRPWMLWVADGYDRNSAVTFLDQCESNWNSGAGYSYLILAQDDAVGVCGLERRIGRGGFEIGYWVHPEHTGRGIATKAAALLVDQAFAFPDIDHVQIWHDAANSASEAVPRRLGFTELVRQAPPRDPPTPGETGIDVIWELKRS